MLEILLSIAEDERERAFIERMYQRYKDTVYTVAHSILHNWADTEDAMLHVFWLLTKNAEKVEGMNEEETRSFVIVVARNAALSFLRGRSRVERHETTLSEESAAESDAFDALVEREQRAAVLNGFRRLPQIYQDALHLHYASGLSVRDAARVAGVTDGAMKKRILRAKALLMKYYRESGVNDE